MSTDGRTTRLLFAAGSDSRILPTSPSSRSSTSPSRQAAATSILALPAAIVSASILTFLTIKEKLREATRLCHAFTALLTVASFSHDQLSLRVSKLPRAWSELSTVRRLVSGVQSVWVKDEEAFQQFPGWDDDEKEENDQNGQSGQRIMSDLLQQAVEVLKASQTEPRAAVMAEEWRSLLAGASPQRAPPLARYVLQQLLTAAHAQCVSVFSSVACLRLALPTKLLVILSEMDDAFLSTIIRSDASFPHLTTLLLQYQDDQWITQIPIAASILRPLVHLPALTALRLGKSNALTLATDCLQLLCGLPRLILLDLEQWMWAYNADVDGPSVVLECSSTLQTLLLPRDRWDKGVSPIDHVDIRAPSLTFLSLHMSRSPSDFQPAIHRFSNLTTLRLLKSPHTVLPQLHDGMARVLPALRHSVFEQRSLFHNAREFGKADKRYDEERLRRFLALLC